MNWNISRKALTVAVMVATFSLNACAGLFGVGGTSWKEEALLHDGSKVIVERSVERKGRHEIGQLPAYTKQTLTFTDPASGKSVTWEDKATEDLGTSSFLPMTLDIYQGVAYLVVTPMGCLAYNKWGRPNPPYVVFRHGGKTWQRIPLQELPLETKALNLIASSPDTEVERLGKRMVDAETIKRVNAEFRQPQYKTILREAVEDPAGRCGEMIPDEHGGWIGMGWFKDQPTREACLDFCMWKKVSAESCPCKTLFRNEE